MPQIDYQHELSYTLMEDGSAARFPGLLVSVSESLGGGVGSVTALAHLDTGAEFSLFNGAIAAALDLPLLEGEPIQLTATTGASIDARFHEVNIEHHVLGRFPLQIAFSLGEIRRNLLGRDFLNLIQIGFRERHGQIYVTPLP
jgi:hypothetical protein